MATFDGCPVLVTGAGGFIGSHLTDHLVRAGAQVRAFVRYNSRGDQGALEWLETDVLDQVEVVRGDLRDPESVARAMTGAERAFHLGAQIGVPYSYANPRDFIETNVLGSLNVAQAALAADVHQIVHASTSEVYGTARFAPITEDHPLEAQSPYSASKIGGDKVMDSFHCAFGLRVTIVRPFNTYGPFQSRRAIIPTIVTQALAVRDGAPLRLGSLEPRRDLTYVADTVAGFVAAGSSHQAVGETVQLGTGVAVTVGELVDLVGSLLGKSLTVTSDSERVRPPDSEVQHLVSDPTRAEKLITWSPQVSLREGMMLTIDWFRRNPDPRRAERYEI